MLRSCILLCTVRTTNTRMPAVAAEAVATETEVSRRVILQGPWTRPQARRIAAALLTYFDHVPIAAHNISTTNTSVARYDAYTQKYDTALRVGGDGSLVARTAHTAAVVAAARTT